MPPSIHLTIPKPCDANWAQMKSEEKSRHCIQCSQSVYSIEDYDESEAMELLLSLIHI